MNNKFFAPIISALFVAIIFFISAGPLLLSLLIPYFPQERCGTELSDNEIRKIVIDEIQTTGLRFLFPHDAVGLKAEDGFWEIKKYEIPINPESEYETNKYEANFTHPNQFVSVFIGMCGGINMIFNKPYAGFDYRKL
ncbi:hypothetical protein [Rhizobium rhizogenes]|uniref:hypothetical protein n=1 Tax=Rhizobium rhizogenes TaxID=359 RepID=UPI0022BE0279|nr:hypothetical protein [Rhizobium rhizogenes]MCZ7485102.1 hypothetical protein [Rhizobium rhizogenes]